MKKRFLALLLTFVLVIVPLGGFAEEADETQPESYGVFKAVMNFIDKNYQFDTTQADIVNAVVKQYLEENPDGFSTILNTIMKQLDEHSVYYTPEEFKQFNQYIESEFAGIGAYLSRNDGYLTVNSVMDDSPAKKANIISGDKIIAVNGENIIGADSDYSIGKIRGQEGTNVVLTILRDGVGQFDVTVTRAILHDTTVSSTVLKDNIGYIEISSFSSQTGKEFDKALATLESAGVVRFIVDLRYNGGGVTDEALSCVAHFIPYGQKMLIVNRKNEGDFEYTSKDKDGKIRKLVVLVNEGTASASEIFTGAIKDNNAGKIVGTKTYGKGTMQTTAGLGEYGGIKLTIAEFFSPSGVSINKKGIIPDYILENKEREVTDDDLVKLTYKKIYEKGQSDEQIYALKQRLTLMKYYNGNLDNYYDDSLANAVTRFQQNSGLFPYGVLDITTQTTINNMMSSVKITDDSQLDKAIEIVKGL